MENIIFYSSAVQQQIYQAKQNFQNTPYAWDPYEIRWPIEVAHRLGLKFYGWIVPYNEGAPPGAHREYGIEPLPEHYPYGLVYATEFGCQTKFVHDQVPEYQLVDRQGKSTTMAYWNGPIRGGTRLLVERLETHSGQV